MSANNEYDFIFNWKIKNYSKIFKRVGEPIESPEFTVGKLNFSKWTIKLYPLGIKHAYYCFVSLIFTRNDDNIKGTLLIDEKMELLTADGAIVQSLTFANRKCEPNTIITASEFVRSLTLKDKLSSLTDDTVTVRYYMRKSREIKVPTSCEAETVHELDKCSFKWIIKYPDVENWSEIKNIPFPAISPLEVRLTSPSDDILINIGMSNEKCLPLVNVGCQISLLEINGVGKKSQTGNHTFDFNESNQTWLFPTFILKSELKANDNYLIDGCFKLLVDIYSSNLSMASQIIKYDYETLCKTESPQTVNSCICLSENLRNLFQSEKFADVKLRLNNKIFLAHKSILVARSPVFSTMFDQDMTESQTGIVDLADIEENILKVFLNYLYTEELKEMNYEIALNLLIIADKYQVPCLYEKCASYLMNNFTEFNSCDILLVADMLKYEALKSSVINYIKKHSSKILPSPVWLKWMEKNIKLGNEVLTQLSIHFGDDKAK